MNADMPPLASAFNPIADASKKNPNLLNELFPAWLLTVSDLIRPSAFASGFFRESCGIWILVNEKAQKIKGNENSR